MKNNKNMQSLDELLKETPKSSSNSTKLEDIIDYVKNGKYSVDVINEYNLNSNQIEENLLLLLDFENDRRDCEGCKGLYMCKKSHPYFQVSLDEYGGFLSRKVGPCPYYKKILKLRKNYVYKQFNPEWNELDVSNLKPVTKRNVKYWSQLQKALSQGNRNWVYVEGPMGSGRSFLTALYCNTCAKKDQKIAFIEANECFQQLKDDSIKNREKFERDMNNLIDSDILVIDDFGSEFKTNYFRDSILLPILNARSKNKKPIIFISDYSLKEIQVLYSYDFQAKIISKNICNLIKMNLSAQIKLPNGMESLL